MKRILIVEDNDLNRKLIRDLLRAHGYETHEARTGAQAIMKAAQIQPDLVIMDMQLPDMNGQEIVRWMRNDLTMAHIPIVAVTAFAQKADEMRIRKAGVDSYLPKPFSIGNFMHTLEQTFLGTSRKACAAS